MKIGALDTEQRVLIVAEAGNNHEGSAELAAELVRSAARAGADAIKFQAIDPEALVARSERERIAQLEGFRLQDGAWRRLSDLAEELGLLFLATPLSLRAVAMLDPLVQAFKIASGDSDFYALLEAIAHTGKPVILSTGMTDPDQIARSKRRLERIWEQAGRSAELALLHCVGAYPTSSRDAGLATIGALQRHGCTVGYSDHCLGTDVAALAVAAGARIVEKHFTLDKQQSEYRDHALAADPPELAELVERIRHIEQVMGDARSGVMDSEKATAQAARRSTVANRDLAAGTKVDLRDLDWVRPSGGLPPSAVDAILGRTLTRDVSRGTQILDTDLS